MVDHDALIQYLVGKASAVSRPLPVAVRALVWSALAASLGLMTSCLLPRGQTNWSVPSADLFVADAGLSFFLGFISLAFAFSSCIPGRRPRGLVWAGALLALWVLINGANVVVAVHPLDRICTGKYCFCFVALAEAPMIAIILFALQRTGSLRPFRTLAIAGSAVGFLGFGLMAFRHPCGMCAEDFVMSILAAVLPTLGLTLIGRRLIAV